MTNRAIAAVALAAVLVLAGCGGTGAPGASGTTESPSEQTPPPGVADGTLTDASALVDAHGDTLLDTGYAYSLSVVGSQPNRTANVTFRDYATVGPDLSTYQSQSRQTGTGPTTVTTIWSNGSVTLSRLQTESETRYSTAQDAQIRSRVTGESVLEGYLRGGNYTVAGTEQRDSRTLTRLTADEYVKQTDESMPAPSNVSAFDATVLADGAGRIHSVNVSMRQQTPSGTLSLDVNYTLRRVGSVAVARPDWVESALAEVTMMDVNVTAVDGSTLRLDHESGDAVGNGSVALLNVNGSQYFARFESALAPGETAYLYVPADATRQAAVVRERPTDATARSLDGPVQLLVGSPDGQNLYVRATVETNR